MKQLLQDVSYIKNLLRSFFSISVIIAVTSCGGNIDEQDKAAIREDFKKEDGFFSKLDPIDPVAGLTRKDYENLFKKNELIGTEEDIKPSLPDVSGLMFAPEPPIIDNDKLVTLSVTEDVPLKEVLVELARRADIDVEIDSAISGGIILRAKDKPFSEVIERVARMANLRYSIDDGVLKIQRDTPYLVHYRMNLLNMVRTSSGSMNISTDLVSGAGSTSDSSGSGLSGGSNISLSEVSDQGDIWQIVEDGLKNIIGEKEEGTVAAIPADISDAGLAIEDSKVISMSRPAGVISMFARKQEHDEIKKYLDYVQFSASSQVLIEAKILEVKLNDEYRTGIDWNFLTDSTGASKARLKFDDLGLATEVADQILSIGPLKSELFGVKNTSIQASASLMETFGITRTLSNPRLHTMNNQYAVLTFAENFVYFELDVAEEVDDLGNTTLTIDSTLQTVPIGVILALQPSIDAERDEIVMNIRPTLSRITGEVDDPGVSIIAEKVGGAAAGVTSTVPVVEKRELDSVLRLKNGQVMVIGGLMEEVTTNADRGVPGIGKTPIIGNAFKSVVKGTDIVETVIFIKATIIPAEGVVSEEDKTFYNKFSKDRHRMKF